jgi:hypothetical protein
MVWFYKNYRRGAKDAEKAKTFSPQRRKVRKVENVINIIPISTEEA